MWERKCGRGGACCLLLVLVVVVVVVYHVVCAKHGIIRTHVQSLIPPVFTVTVMVTAAIVTIATAVIWCRYVAKATVMAPDLASVTTIIITATTIVFRPEKRRR